MKVLQVVKTSEGAAWAYDQASALIQQGVEVITVIPDLKGKVAKRYIESGYPLIEADVSLPIKQPWKFFQRAKKIKSIVRDVCPDLIHMHFLTNVVMLRLRKCVMWEITLRKIVLF